MILLLHYLPREVVHVFSSFHQHRKPVVTVEYRTVRSLGGISLRTGREQYGSSQDSHCQPVPIKNCTVGESTPKALVPDWQAMID
jgi:hypothetical protein